MAGPLDKPLYAGREHKRPSGRAPEVLARQSSGAVHIRRRRLYVAGEDIGVAMLQAMHDGERVRIIENREIRAFANRARGGK